MVGSAFPTAEPPDLVEEWISLSGGAGVLVWSNEGPPSDWLMRKGENLLVVLGMTSRGGLFAMQTARRLAKGIFSVPGTFTAVRCRKKRIEIASSVMPASQLYFGETEDIHVVASRAALVSALCGNVWLKVDNILAFHSMVRAGFLTGVDTPYKNVRLLPLNSSVMMGDGFCELSEPEHPVGVTGEPCDVECGAATVAEALVESLALMRDRDVPLSLSLSGGRDSRLMAAALHAAGVPFEAVTIGFPGDTDVELAKVVAEKLRIPIRVQPRADNSDGQMYVEHPVNRACRVVDLAEATTSAWDDVHPPTGWLGRVSISGIGGEVLRGGYAYSMNEVTVEKARRKVHNIFGASPLHTVQSNEAAQARAEYWLRVVEEDVYRAMDLLYLYERLGRWGLARASVTTRNAFFSPFLDNLVLRSVLGIPPDIRMSERLSASLVSRLAPELTDVPLEGRPWRFVTSDHREPTPRAVRRDWRLLTDTGLYELIATEVLPHEDEDPLCGLVNAKELRRVIEDRTIRPSTLWHLLTVRVALEFDRYGTYRQAREMTVPVIMSSSQ